MWLRKVVAAAYPETVVEILIVVKPEMPSGPAAA